MSSEVETSLTPGLGQLTRDSSAALGMTGKGLFQEDKKIFLAVCVLFLLP